MALSVLLCGCTGPANEKTTQNALEQQNGAAMAESFVRNSSTYIYDGYDIKESGSDKVGDSAHYIYVFSSRNSGYGNRKDKAVDREVTAHVANITVQDGRVVIAFLDGKYNMLEDEMEGEPLCKDSCGDGICQEVVCEGDGCPCPETETSCPKDCKSTAIDRKYCAADSDCACGRSVDSSQCLYGNKKYVDPSKKCPEYCNGTAGEFPLTCVANQCFMKVSSTCIGEGRRIGGGNAPCCEGLKKVPDIAGPDASGRCAAVYVSSGSVCAMCGDGVCGTGENACNCPVDCSNATRRDPLREASIAYIKTTQKYVDYKGVNLTETNYKRVSSTEQDIWYNYSSGLNKTAGRVEQVEIRLIFENGRITGKTETIVNILGKAVDYCGFSTNGTCSVDVDCMVSGCNHEVCQSRSETPVVTQCSDKECFSALDYGMECQCWYNHCRWFK